MVSTELPPTLMPFYETPKPNRNVLLYRGRLRLLRGKESTEGLGTVHLAWLPVPRVIFKISPSSNVNGLAGPGLAKLHLPSLGASGSVYSSGMSIRDGRVQIEGSLRGSMERPPPPHLTRVVFHVVGFWPMEGDWTQWSTRNQRGMTGGRLHLQAAGWSITLDPVIQSHGPTGLTAALRNVQGYGITHVGEIRHGDGKEFTPDEANDVLSELGHFLSFARGAWCFPILPVGFDSTDARCWENWSLNRIDPFFHTRTWCTDKTSDALVGAFPGFLARKRHRLWGEPVEFAINWYVEACSGQVTVDTATIIEQTALEMLAWVLVVEDQKNASAAEFEQHRRYPAHAKVRLLLDWAHIPLDVPAQLSDLAALALAVSPSGRPGGTCDGPSIFTLLRNRVAHAKTTRLLRDVPLNARAQVRNLGLWYLELVLLRLFDHQGVYSNATDRNKRPGIEKVPWAPR